ncbi:MAG: methyl-accepting chemotaxis protein, partial [Ferrovibrio sp.]|nr:methyl-accepting chemotaxis protein [Ferrovibrio sp.]
LDQINTAVGSMDEMTQRNAALVEESTAAAQTLNNQAVQLAELVGFFKVDAGMPHAMPATPAGAAPRPLAHSVAKTPALARVASAPKKPALAVAAAKPAAAEDWQEF